MSAEADAMTTSSAAPANTRPFYWSVRRELWENRSVYMAPVVAAAVVLFGFLLSALSGFQGMASGTGHRTGAMWRSTRFQAEAYGAGPLDLPYQFAIMPIFVTGMIVAVFYCLNALHNERRDRSVLFWKSLPVSDLTTVLSKAFIPLVAVPAAIAATVIGLHLVMLPIHAVALLSQGRSPAELGSELPLAQTWGRLIYGVAALALWLAPIYGWLLLVSGWARRAPFLWAVLPPLAVGLLESIVLGSHPLGSLLTHRLSGGYGAAFTDGAIDPVKFLSTPDLWAGLVVAAGFLAAAVWQRRYREPN